MEKISSDILAVINEAAVIVRAGKINFANFSAQELIGPDCVGKKAQTVFGHEIIGCQSSAFIAEIVLNGTACAASVKRIDGQQLILLSPVQKPDSILNEPFLCTMRNSLMSVELVTNLLRTKAEELRDTEILDKLAVLSKHYYRMTRLINNASFILNDDELAACAVVSVNISQLYSELLKSCAFFTGDIEIKTDLGNDIILNCDVSLIKKLLLNLISNCIAHAKGCTRISVTLIDSPDKLILSVSDDGEGIAPGELHKVFDRYRYGFDISEMGKGAGLGLTVARRIARIHGGTLLLESRSGIGTSVRVSLEKRLSPVRSFHSSDLKNHPIRDDILLELSECLPPEYYSEKYMD